MDSGQMLKSQTAFSKSRESLQQPEEQNIETSSPLKRQTQNQTRYKSFCSLVIHVSMLSLSSLYFGYIMAYLSSIDFGTIMKVYSITFHRQLAQGLLVACIPIGGASGALISRFFICRLSRRNNLLMGNLFAIIAGFLIFIQRFDVLLAARILQGICVGFFGTTGTLMMKQIAPIEISGTLLSFNQIFISFGIFFAFVFSLIMSVALNDPLGQRTWWIIFGFPLIISVTQSFLMLCVHPYETPKYHFKYGEQTKGRELVERIYKQQYVQQEIRNIKQALGQIIERSQGNKSQMYTLSANQSGLKVQHYQRDTPRTAVIVAIHLAALQQFCGINAVIAYGGEIVGGNNPTIKLVLPLLINFQQVVGALFASYLLTVVGRKALLQVGSFMACIGCAIIAVGFFMTQSSPGLSIVLIVFGLVLFMANFGFTLGPVVWVYLPEIVQPNVLPYATLVNWLSAAAVMFLFPVIKQKLPDKNPALLFLFFAIWSTLSYFFNKKFVIETKNKGQRQIFEEYQSGRQIKEV